MAHMLAPHWIPAHVAGSDRDVFARWNPAFIEALTNDEQIPYLDYIPAGAQVVVRHYPTSDQLDRAEREPFGKRWFASAADASATGQRIADVMSRIAVNAIKAGFPLSRLLFEGPLNEPNLWAGEPPELYGLCCLSFLRRMHLHGLRSVICNTGVGWPNNSGPDTPPVWDWLTATINEFKPGDYLGLHEYWALNGPGENWRWWAGRFLQCPFQVPMMITECGIDTGVSGAHFGGWQDLPGSYEDKAKRYVDELYWYAEQCKADGRPQALFVFTYDMASSHWEKFNIRNESFVNALLSRPMIEAKPYVVAPPPPPPPPPPPVVDPILAIREAAWNARSIAYNPNAALAIYARQHSMGAPLTGEIDKDGYRLQGFTGGIAYCRIPEWGNVKQVAW